jgi:ArsR family transcriptional regulator, virulence genes transcriptional regulator
MRSKKVKFELTRKQIEAAAQSIHVISHPIRMLLLYALSKQDMSVGDLSELAKVSQSLASQHLSKMKDYGILDSRRESNRVYYFLKEPNFVKVLELALQLSEPLSKK